MDELLIFGETEYNHVAKQMVLSYNKGVRMVWKMKFIKSIIQNGFNEAMKEKKQFDQDFSNVSDRIAEKKAEMKERTKKRNLIRNR